MTQPQFAKLLGVSAATVQSIETGRLKISPKLVLRLHALNESGTVEAAVDKLVAEYRAKLEATLT